MRFQSLIIASIAFTIIVSVADSASDCKRKKVPKGRTCRKECKEDSDCNNKKTCNCDDVCGMTCFKLDAKCDALEKISNGKVKANGTIYGSVAVYSCDEGFEMKGKSQRTCQSDKKWSGKAPQCLESACEFPPRLSTGFPNVDQSKDLFKVGDVVTYKCRFGYTLTGNPNITCLENRNWSPAKFLCSKVSCGKPVTPENGYFEGNDFLFGSWVIYKCNKGYEILEPIKARRYCLTTTEWSGTPPKCEIKSCPPPISPEHGDVEYSTTTYGSVVRYICDQGYLIDGNDEGFCDDKNSWGDLPKCVVDINCKFQASVRPLCGYTNQGVGQWERKFFERNRDGLPTYAATFAGNGGNAILRSPRVPDGKPHCLKFYYYAESEMAANDLVIYLNGQRVSYLAQSGIKIPTERWVGFQASLIPAEKEIIYEISFDGNVQFWIDDIQVDKTACVSSCERLDLCENGGVCVDEIDTSYCSCPDEYTGKACEIEVSCERPTIQFGIVKGPDRLKFGSRLTFLCQKGYERRGPSFALCGEKGLSAEPPKCFKIVTYDGECPRGFIGHQLMCYKYYHDRKTYNDARKVCHSNGAELATIQSKSVHSFLFKHSPNWPWEYYIWIGLRSIDFRQFWLSGYEYSGGEEVDFDLAGAGSDECGVYHYKRIPLKSSLWRIEIFNCHHKHKFICETWKRTARSYKLTSNRLHSIGGVYKPVPGLLTGSGRQIFRKETGGEFIYLYHALHPDNNQRRWYVGEYSIRFGRPGRWKARANSDELYPDRIGSSRWENRNSVGIFIEIVENNKWSQWTEWECDVTCGQGISERSRTCTVGQPGSMNCVGEDVESKPCHLPPCGVSRTKYEVEVGETLFTFKTDKVSWRKANRLCVERGSRLAISTDDIVQSALQAKIAEFRKEDESLWKFWINGLDRNPEWTFANGTVIASEQQKWAPNEPNRLGEEQMCIELWVTGWNDHGCSTPTGYICQKVIPSNPCALNPCMSNRVCKRAGRGYICDCPEGTVEPDCTAPEIAEGENAGATCAPNSCNNGGKCAVSDNEDGFVCFCSPDRKGKYCEYDRDAPDMSTESMGGTTKMTTEPETALERKTKPTTVPRSGNPCKDEPCNGGTCSSSDTDPEGFLCFCKPGNLGKRCEIRNICRLDRLSGDIKAMKDGKELGRSEAVAKNDEISIECSNSGEIPLGSPKMTCLGDDQWSRSIKILCVSKESSCSLDSVDSTFEVYRSDSEIIQSFPFVIDTGESVTFKCEINGGTKSFENDCIDGKWQSGMPKRCAAVTCPDLQAPENGAMNVMPKEAQSPFEPGVRISFSCGNSHQLNGASVVTCRRDGSWTSPVPTCSERGCFLFYLDLNRDVFIKDHKDDVVAKVGESYTLKCKKAKKTKTTVTCMGNDVWEPDILDFNCPPKQ